MNMPFTFPVFPEDFCAYQETLTNRPLTENEREILNAWVPLFNDSFRAGVRNDGEWLKRKMEIVDRLSKEYAGSHFFTDFLKVSRNWIDYAWKQGRKVAA